MYNHNKAQQSKNRVHISWDILYLKCKVGSRYNAAGFSVILTVVKGELWDVCF